MKKIYWLVLATTVAMAGCGKAGISEETKIVSDCSLNGRGEYKCTFKNKGTAKGSLCEHIVLRANPGYQRYFGIFPYFGDADYKDIVKYSNAASRGLLEFVEKNKNLIEPSLEDRAKDEEFIQRKFGVNREMELVWIEKIKQAMKNSGKRLDEFIAHYRAALAVQAFEIDKKGLSQTEVCSGIVEAGDVREVNGLSLFGSEGISPSDACHNPYGDRKWTGACSFSTVSIAEIDKLVKAKIESTSPK
ncbi:MAG: hypothetical protein ACYC1F_05420 [Gallionellaceae bacterium]